MIEQCARRFSGYLIEHGAAPEQREVYSYSVECILNLFFSDLLLFSIGLLLHQIPALLVWNISYTLLRVNIGGYHASTHGRCILAGTAVGLISLPLNHLWFMLPGAVTVLLLVILLDIGFLAPVPHERRPVTLQKKKKARIHALIVTVSGFLLALLLHHMQFFIGNAILSGFACALLLSLAAAALHLKKGVSYEQ